MLILEKQGCLAIIVEDSADDIPSPVSALSCQGTSWWAYVPTTSSEGAEVLPQEPRPGV